MIFRHPDVVIAMLGYFVRRAGRHDGTGWEQSSQRPNHSLDEHQDRLLVQLEHRDSRHHQIGRQK